MLHRPLSRTSVTDQVLGDEAGNLPNTNINYTTTHVYMGVRPNPPRPLYKLDAYPDADPTRTTMRTPMRTPMQ